MKIKCVPAGVPGTQHTQSLHVLFTNQNNLLTNTFPACLNQPPTFNLGQCVFRKVTLRFRNGKTGRELIVNEKKGKRLIKREAESNSPTFHLVICFTLFPLGILHLADIQLCTNNQLSLQICGDSAVALCQAFSHFQWIFLPDKKLRVTKASVPRAGIINPFIMKWLFC